MSNGTSTYNAFERPASVFSQAKQPADNQDLFRRAGMPPNAGDFVVPHAVEFLGIMRTIARNYLPSDEALIDSRENARYMRNDVGIMECLEQRERSVALLDWHLEVPDEKDPTQKQLAEDLTEILKATPDFMKYREVLQDAIWYGKNGVQQRFRWKDIMGKQRLCVDQWLPLNGDKIVFRYDDGTGQWKDGQVGIRVGAGFTGRLVTGINTENRWKQIEATDWGLCYFLRDEERPLLAIHKHRVEDGEYEAWEFAGRIHGVGIRSRIYWEWMQKQEALAYLMELLERSAGGIEIWPYPAGNPAAKDMTKKAAEERIGNSRNVVLMPVWPDMDMSMLQVRVIDLNMSGAQIIHELLDKYFGHRIKRYVLGQTLTSEAASTGLGSGVASIHLDTYLQIIRYDAINLGESLTRELVEPLRNFNFPQLRSIPVRLKINTESPDIEGKLKAWYDAWQMGKKIPDKELGNLIGCREPNEGEPFLQNPQASPQNQGPATGQPGIGAGVDPRQAMVEQLKRELSPEVARYMIERGMLSRTIYRKNGEVLRYRAAHPSEGGGQWAGNFHVNAEGVIDRGCAGVKGQKVDEIGEGETPEHRKVREHRQAVAEHKGLKGEDIPRRGVGALDEHPHPETGKNARGEQVAPAKVDPQGRLPLKDQPEPKPKKKPKAEPTREPGKDEETEPERKAILNPRSRTAADWGLSPDDLADAVEFIAERRQEAGGHDRNRALQAARKLTGMFPSDVKKLKNAGMDFTSFKRLKGKMAARLQHWDTFAQELARQYPELELGDPDDRQADFGQALWNVLDEDKAAAVRLDDPEILREAAMLVQVNAGGDMGEAIGATYQDEAVPFAARFGPEVVMKYREWLAVKRYVVAG